MLYYQNWKLKSELLILFPWNCVWNMKMKISLQLRHLSIMASGIADNSIGCPTDCAGKEETCHHRWPPQNQEDLSWKHRPKVLSFSDEFNNACDASVWQFTAFTVRCRYNAVSFLLKKNHHKTQPIVARVFSELKPWFIFCPSQCNAVCNTLWYWAAL